MAKVNVPEVLPYFRAELAKANSDAHGTRCEDLSLTRQSETEDADINTIVRRFGLTGTMPRDMPPLLFGDFTDIGDYQSAFAAVADANERFMMMPHEVRSKFANDPQKFLEFCTTPGNEKAMRELGLFVPTPEAPKPMEVIVKNAVTEPPKVVVTAQS